MKSSMIVIPMPHNGQVVFRKGEHANKLKLLHERENDIVCNNCSHYKCYFLRMRTHYYLLGYMLDMTQSDLGFLNF